MPSTTSEIKNLFDTAQVIALVAGFLIPFVVAKLTTAQASDNVKTLLAFVATGLTALGTYLLDAGGAHTWQGALSVFVIAMVIAATTRKTFTEQFVQKAQASGGIIGPKQPPLK